MTHQVTRTPLYLTEIAEKAIADIQEKFRVEVTGCVTDNAANMDGMRRALDAKHSQDSQDAKHWLLCSLAESSDERYCKKSGSGFRAGHRSSALVSEQSPGCFLSSPAGTGFTAFAQHHTLE